MSKVASLVISGPSATFRYRVGTVHHETEEALYLHDVTTYESIMHAETAATNIEMRSGVSLLTGQRHRAYLECGVMLWTPDKDDAAELMKRLQARGFRLE